MITQYAPVIDAWLRADIKLKGSVIHERLVDQYQFPGHYQRVKLYLQQARPRIAAELGLGRGDLAGLHRRFEVVPGAQAQVDWGDEGRVLVATGIFTWSCRTRGIRSAASPSARTCRRSGTATAGPSSTSGVCPE